MVTCAIEDHEEISVVIIDIPGAYLHTDTDKHIIMLLNGRLAYIIALIYPNKYMEFVIQNDVCERKQSTQSSHYVKTKEKLYDSIAILA